jgi:GT2 family glycosyltransferase
VRIRIQSILYAPSAGSLARFVRGLAETTAHLLATDPRAVVTLALGDCAPVEALSPGELAVVTNELRAAGVDAVDYRHFGANLGHGGGQNRLLAERGGATHIWILNPDTCVAPRCLAELVAMMGDSTVGIAEARQVPLEHQKSYDPDSGETSWATGACALVRATVFDTIGTFDATSFFLYCDDVDLSWRARLAGYKVVHQPAAVVFHDKELSVTASYVPGVSERYHSALASLLLAAKYSRPDIVAARLVDLDNSPDPVHADAAAEYRARMAARTLAAPIDPTGAVGQFQTYAYANLSFDYSFG